MFPFLLLSASTFKLISVLLFKYCKYFLLAIICSFVGFIPPDESIPKLANKSGLVQSARYLNFPISGRRLGNPSSVLLLMSLIVGFIGILVASLLLLI